MTTRKDCAMKKFDRNTEKLAHPCDYGDGITRTICGFRDSGTAICYWPLRRGQTVKGKQVVALIESWGAHPAELAQIPEELVRTF